LHVHSVFSDGTCTVNELVRSAKKAGISVMALTDHDTLDGLKDFKRECGAFSISPVAGIELSAMSDRTVHILGYRMERPERIENALAWVRDRRDARNARMISLLCENGLEITLDDVKREAGGRVFARPHIARALVAKGYVPDIPSAFARYIGRGGVAHVPREGLSPEDCVRTIREAGGLPVLAHPSLTGLDAEGLGELLETLKEHGLWGLECISSHCSSEAAYGYLSIAAKYSLFPTAGSDFHGSVRPQVKLGVQVSDDFLPWARLGVNFCRSA
jgi:predicted metal-dependent phosphoesterase TrpH